MNEFWSAFWIPILNTNRNVLVIEHYELIKENKQSSRFKIESEEITIEFSNDNELRIVGKNTREHYTTIRKDVIDSITKFNSREEAIDYLINVTRDEIEYYKRKLECLPRVVDFLEEVKRDKV